MGKAATIPMLPRYTAGECCVTGYWTSLQDPCRLPHEEQTFFTSTAKLIPIPAMSMSAPGLRENATLSRVVDRDSQISHLSEYHLRHLKIGTDQASCWYKKRMKIVYFVLRYLCKGSHFSRMLLLRKGFTCPF